MGKLTRFKGGQVVTEGAGASSNVTERNFVVFDSNYDETNGSINNIYVTRSVIQNSVQITNFELLTTSSLTRGAHNVGLRITGDEGSTFSIVGSHGASDLLQQTILPGTTFTDVMVAVSAQGTGSSERNPSFMLVADPNSNPETVLADEFTATNPIVVTQEAGLLQRPNPWSTSAGGDSMFTWDGGGQASISTSQGITVRFGGQGLFTSHEFNGPGSNGVVTTANPPPYVGYYSGGRVEHQGSGNSVTITIPATGGYAEASFGRDISF